MEQQITKATLIREAIKVLLILALLIGTTMVVVASETLTVKGHVLLYDAGFENVEIELISTNPDADVLLLPGGKFRVKLQVGGTVLLRFKKDGYATKEIEIDTENVFASKKAKKENRSLNFDVELMPENLGRNLIFAAPVGQIWFLKGSGLMRITYDYELLQSDHAMWSNGGGM